MAWLLVACLVTLRDEFDALAPDRDRSADGSIGDLAHRQEVSDHNPDETGKTPYEDADGVNEVHAIDIDSTGPWPAGRDLDSRVEIIRRRHQSGRDDRLQNIIWRARIASRSWGWTWHPYTGPSRHFDHAHFSARYTAGQESDTSPWGVLEGDDMPSVDDLLSADKIPNDINPGEPGKPGYNPTMSVEWALRYAARAQLALDEARAARKDIALLSGQIKQLAGKDFVDEQAIVAGLLAGLPPERIAAGIPADMAERVVQLLAARLAA